MTATAPYGSWRSPITSELVVRGSVRLGDVRLDESHVYWNELRPAERGRSVVVRTDAEGRTTDVVPTPYNARTRVHEYGGASFCVANGSVYFTNFTDQRLYVAEPGRPPRPLTGEGPRRYAAMTLDAPKSRLLTVVEDHGRADEPENYLAAVSLTDGSIERLHDGADFYAYPTLDTERRRLAWIQWAHPNMPWDGTELWMAEADDPASAVRVAGGEQTSIFQPEWHPDGSLVYVSDETGFWNLHRHDGVHGRILCQRAAEFGLPLWTLGMSTYGIARDGRIVSAYAVDGEWSLAIIDPATGKVVDVETEYSEFWNVRARDSTVYFGASSPTRAQELVALDLPSNRCRVLRRFSDVRVDAAYMSAPRRIQYPSADGERAHALFYPPANGDFEAPAGEKPPLIVKSHGGPTGAASSTLSLKTQYWTSRGFAVLDVDYGGSTGYGRRYRERLDGKWGIVDVDDCVAGARWLAERGEVDGERLVITGGSAGGYTTLAALAFRNVFHAGASHYGISDLETLATDTHKFESRYLDRLIGPYPAQRDTYVERSPIHHVEGLDCPVIFFQGLEDAVVPPDQAERMVRALDEKGIAVAYVPFEGEQHGFRQAANIRRAIDGELYFYSRVFGFELADPIDPLPIAHLD